MLFADQNPGSVVWHTDIRPCLRSTVPEDGVDVITGPDGTTWYKKGRYLIIVSRRANDICEIPLFTYNGTGLEGKPEIIKSNFLSVRPPKLAQGSTFKNQSSTNPVIDIAYTKREDEDLKSTRKL